MGTFADLLVGVGFTSSASSLSKVQSDAEALKGTLSKILGTVGIAFSLNGIKNFIQETASAAADMKSINEQFRLTFKGTEEEASSSLKKLSENTGIAETRMKQSFTRMAAFARTTGMEQSQSIDFSTRAMEALADNAAYFDKSIEYTQETFQKLLKGNFQLDDNLGFNLAESERNKMAQEMYGESSYNNLEDWQKQELILEKLIRANEEIGAEGQASVEAGLYTNQVGELSDALQQLKVSIGGIFLDPMLKVMTKIKEVAFDIAEGLGDLEDKGSLVSRMSVKLTAIVERLLGYVDKGVSAIKWLINLVGGLENALKLLGVVMGVIAGFMIVDKITKVAGALAKVNWKLVGIIALALALYLVIDDFMAFMRGDNSVMGVLLEKAGIDPNAVRQKVTLIRLQVLNLIAHINKKIRDIKQTAADTVDNIKGKIDEFFNGGGFASFVSNVRSTIDDIRSKVEDFLNSDTFAGIVDIVQGELGKVKMLYTTEFEGICKVIDSAKDAFGRIKESMEQFGQSDTAKVLLEALKDVLIILGGIIYTTAAVISSVFVNSFELLAAAIQVAADVVQFFVDLFTGNFDALDDDLSAIMDDIITGVTDFAQGVVDTLTELLGGLPAKALQWGSDMVRNFIGGIGGFAGKVGEAIGGGLQWLQDNAGHSKPKEGPLKDDDKWMPDMMDNFINGINSKKQQLKTAANGIVNTLAGGSDGINAMNGGASGILAASNAGSSYSIIQNISFANTFNGDTRSNQVAAGNQMRSNANDTSTYLANAIAFGR